MERRVVLPNLGPYNLSGTGMSQNVWISPNSYHTASTVLQSSLAFCHSLSLRVTITHLTALLLLTDISPDDEFS